VLGDIALVFEVLGWFLPFGGVLQVLGVVPIALLATRHRSRAAVVATAAIATAGFVIGGLGLVVQAWLFGSLGIALGLARRRGGGALTAVWLGTLITGLPAALGSLALSAIFPSLRKLLLAQVNIYGRGIARICVSLGLSSLAHAIVDTLNWVNGHWYVSYPSFELVAIAIIAGICGRYLRPLLDRLQRDAVPVQAAPAIATSISADGGGGSGEVAPLPVALRNASYRYEDAPADAAQDVSFEVKQGDLTLLVGPNGSGKSTVARLLAGLQPTSGEVVRPGDAGLGCHGGTAMIFQRPESQVLGVRVRDDVVFGLPAAVACDIPELLRHVGLDGMEDRETSTLSGGELQRLAIAGALAREPQLVISDESTSMLDTEGQRSVEELLGRLAGEGVAVVHATHRLSARLAPAQVVTLRARAARVRAPGAGGGKSRAGAVGEADLEAEADDAGAGREPGRPAAVRLRGVGHVYAAGTPWAHRALEGIDLDVEPGEGVVITGANGSGKSTLAWVLSGLVAPSEGEATVGGRRAVESLGQVGIAFQHARLQLIRPTVASDVAYGSDRTRARAALELVGLDPERVGPRRVDALSGGEQRRVALAGVLARDPVLVVLDEPLAGLDEDTRSTLEGVLRHLRRDAGVATLLIAHDLEAAAGMGERLITLEQGRLVSDTALQGARR
jgi:energy-coupling factor transport system ATP-binding protein